MHLALAERRAVAEGGEHRITADDMAAGGSGITTSASNIGARPAGGSAACAAAAEKARSADSNEFDPGLRRGLRYSRRGDQEQAGESHAN